MQPSGFTATKACTQTAQTAVWREAASGLPCNCKATPRGQWKKAELLRKAAVFSGSPSYFI
ncbi:hypothetical protein A4V09_24460 [Blautia pseudococcoides]|uniref:Uncharacterized protein n=1 Tax=Blautia pseudococcoides TaxID=1796616 RepID=A0A1V0QF76_9FIRM|nr:hypothetical protein A4V09_24460 [Blautia pseudococcoides]